MPVLWQFLQRWGSLFFLWWLGSLYCNFLACGCDATEAAFSIRKDRASSEICSPNRIALLSATVRTLVSTDTGMDICCASGGTLGSNCTTPTLWTCLTHWGFSHRGVFRVAGLLIWTVSSGRVGVLSLEKAALFLISGLLVSSTIWHGCARALLFWVPQIKLTISTGCCRYLNLLPGVLCRTSGCHRSWTHWTLRVQLVFQAWCRHLEIGIPYPGLLLPIQLVHMFRHRMALAADCA